MPPFYLVVLVFSFWMIFDAIRRSAALHWYLIILFLPFGAFVYFFVVKIRDYNLRRILAVRTPYSPLGELRNRAAAAPNPANQLALADALYDREALDEAAQIYRAVLDDSRDDKHALLGLARCLVGLERPGEAVEQFERLLELDREYADYSAALQYGEALWQNGRKDEAVELLEAIARATGRLNHKIAHAHYLSLLGHVAHARTVLGSALRDWETGSALTRRRNEKWAQRARHMLEELDRSAQ